MKSGYLFLESIIIGSGSFLIVLLTLLLIFEVDISFVGEFSNLLLLSEWGWIMVGPLIGIVFILGLITERITYLPYSSWENHLYKSIQPIGAPVNLKADSKYYYELITYIYSNVQSQEMARLISYLDSKIRICRSWSIISILLMILLIIEESRLEDFHPLLIPGIVIAGILMLGSLVAWFISVNDKIKCLEKFNETLLK